VLPDWRGRDFSIAKLARWPLLPAASGGSNLSETIWLKAEIADADTKLAAGQSEAAVDPGLGVPRMDCLLALPDSGQAAGGDFERWQRH